MSSDIPAVLKTDHDRAIIYGLAGRSKSDLLNILTH
jgi:hypothetical protein